MLCILLPGVCLAQLAIGTITGVVRDSAGGVIRGAEVQAVSRATGHARKTTTGEQGEYSIPVLSPDEYDVTVEAVSFQRIVRAASVEAGTTTRADFVLRVGDVTDSVRVEAATPQIHYDSAAASGSITRDQIEGVAVERTQLSRARQTRTRPATAHKRQSQSHGRATVNPSIIDRLRMISSVSPSAK
jgi:hypothetical protein